MAGSGGGVDIIVVVIGYLHTPALSGLALSFFAKASGRGAERSRGQPGIFCFGVVVLLYIHILSVWFINSI